MPHRIAIIGAGVSGLAAAYRLAEADAELLVFEKSKGLSGRAASRTKNGCRFDHGANYFKVGGNDAARLLFDELPTDDLCRIVGDIVTFDRDGNISPGDKEQNAAAKWSYRSGISTIGKLMVEVASLSVTREARIVRMVRSQNLWTLYSDTGEAIEEIDAVLLTPPAPQSAAIIEASDFDPAPRSGILSELGKAQYHSQFSVMVNFPGERALPGNAFAMINSDREHDIAWVSHENRKPGHVPKGESLFVIQLSPQWSQDHFDDPRDAVVQHSLAALRDLLKTEFPEPNWTDTQRWKYAHPYSACDSAAMKRTSTIGLFFAGDSFVGKGRISCAIETGLTAAEEIGDFLAQL